MNWHQFFRKDPTMLDNEEEQYLRSKSLPMAMFLLGSRLIVFMISLVLIVLFLGAIAVSPVLLGEYFNNKWLILLYVFPALIWFAYFTDNERK